MRPLSRPAPAGTGGFTLIELLVLLVLLAVVLSLAAPSMSGVTARNSTRGAIDQVSADIAYARVLAVREGYPVSLRITSATRYVVTVDRPTVDTVKRVELARDYAGLALGPSTGTLTFGPRGFLRTSGLDKITATRGGAADSVRVMATGRPYRDY